MMPTPKYKPAEETWPYEVLVDAMPPKRLKSLGAALAFALDHAHRSEMPVEVFEYGDLIAVADHDNETGTTSLTPFTRG